MPREARRKRLHDLQQTANQTHLIRVTTTIHVYERGEKGPRIVNKCADIDVVLSPLTGERWFSDSPRFEELAPQCQEVPIVIGVYEQQLRALYSTADIIGIMGGSRAGKSHVLAVWLFRQWLLRGNGKGDRENPGLYWWVAQTLEKAFKVGVKKIAQVIPRVLRGAMPRNHHVSDLSVTMCDGAKIEFHHAHGDGDNLKGERIEAGAADEITAWSHIENWRVLNDRTLDTEAQIAVASTPKAGHWAREEIIRRARETDTVMHIEISQFDNPWIAERSIWRKLVSSGALTELQLTEIMKEPTIEERARAARAVIEDPFVLRDRFGVWAADGLALYSSYDAERHVVTNEPNFEWVTHVAVTSRFSGHQGEAFYVGGQDFNVNPMTTVIAKVFKHHETGKWGFYFCDEVQTVGTIEQHCKKLHARYPGIAIACDSTGCLPGVNPSQRQNASSTNVKIMREWGFDARPCHRVKETPHNPPPVDTINLWNRLFHQGRSFIDKRCTSLRVGMESSAWDSDGKPHKVSGRKTDRISAAPDAGRYLVWRVCKSEFLKAEVNWS